MRAWLLPADRGNGDWGLGNGDSGEGSKVVRQFGVYSIVW